MKKISIVFASIALVLSIIALSISVIAYKNTQSDSDKTEKPSQITAEGSSISSIEGNPAMTDWNIQNGISKEASVIFDEATGKLAGVSYKPYLLATQITNGTNYSFICKITPNDPSMQSRFVVVNIFQPLKGTCVITKISQINF